MKKYFFVGCLISIFVLTLSCKKSDEFIDADEASSNISESAVAQAGQHTTATEGATTPMISAVSTLGEDLQSLDFVDPQTIHQTAACTFSSARSTCTSNVSTINWNNCTLGNSTLSGGWTETWSSCANGATPGALTSGSVTRVSSGETLTLLSGAKITTSTTAHTTYDNTAISGAGIQIGVTSGTRTIIVNGLHRTMTGPLGKAWFDHSFTGTITATGTRAAGNRLVGGSLTFFHNLAKYKATHSFNSLKWGDSSCCYPTDGDVTTTITGGTKTGSVKMDFHLAGACGEAMFTDTDGSKKSVSLSQCQ